MAKPQGGMILKGRMGGDQLGMSTVAGQQMSWQVGDTDSKQGTASFARIQQMEHMRMKPKNTICLWFDKDAQEAANFYSATFPDSKVTAVHQAPGDFPGGKKGDVLTVEFTVLGIPCLGLNGGPTFKHSEAF